MFSVLAATTASANNDPRAESVNPVKYYYGMDLDVRRVISLTDTSDKIGVVPTTLVYEDSQGRIKAVEFSQAARLGSEG